jgi:hypothetical protein
MNAIASKEKAMVYAYISIDINALTSKETQ